MLSAETRPTTWMRRQPPASSWSFGRGSPDSADPGRPPANTGQSGPETRGAGGRLPAASSRLTGVGAGMAGQVGHSGAATLPTGSSPSSPSGVHGSRNHGGAGGAGRVPVSTTRRQGSDSRSLIFPDAAAAAAAPALGGSGRVGYTNPGTRRVPHRNGDFSMPSSEWQTTTQHQQQQPFLHQQQQQQQHHQQQHHHHHHHQPHAGGGEGPQGPPPTQSRPYAPPPSHGGDLPPPAPAQGMERKFSARSEHTLDRLQDFEQQCEEIDATTASILDAFRSGVLPPGKARDDLAQLEAKLDRLQCEGIDSIDTFELKTGKDQARALRKALTKRAEEMHGRMEEAFAAFQEGKAAAAAA